MTSESMILNKDGITLASDLAVTTPENKSYKSGSKIYKLTDEYPIAIMINGNLDFERISLETLIGEYAESVDFSEVKTVEEIKDGFLNHLSENTGLTSFDDYLSWILDDFKLEFSEEIFEYGFDKTLGFYKQKELKDYLKTYKNFSDKFFDLIPDDKDKNKYNLEIWKIFSYYLSFEGTGIIFAGFDDENYYPSYFEINLHCNDREHVIYDEVDSGINCEELVIKAFAINEEACTFLTGVSNDFEEYLKSYLKRFKDEFLFALEKKLLRENYACEEVKDMISSCNLYLNDVYSNIIQIIKSYKVNAIGEISEFSEYLPEKILWNLASLLIELTAIKQKFSSENETVSSEAEIAFITKINGFTWVKKEYVTFK